MTKATNFNAAKATSAANVRKLVGAAVRSVGSFNERFQMAGIAIMEHANLYDDVTGAKELCRACPKRLRNGLINWFRTYSPIGVNIDARDASKDKHGYVPLSKRNPYNIEGAKANPWFEDRMNPDKEPVPLKTLTGFWSDITSYVERQKKAISNDGEGGKEPRYSPDERETMLEELATLEKFVNRERAKSLADKYAGKAFPPEKVASNSVASVKAEQKKAGAERVAEEA